MPLRTYDVTRLMNNLQVALPGALTGAIQLEIFNVLNEFLQKTDIWQESINFSISPSNAYLSTIEIVPSAGQINRLIYVVDTNQLQRRMSMPTPGYLQVIELASGAETWTARVALTCTDPLPTNGALANLPLIPGWILSKYNNGIMSGVLARMMAQPAKPYTNPKLAVMHQRIYKNAENEGKTESRRQNLFDGQAWSFPQGFATRHQRNRGWG